MPAITEKLKNVPTEDLPQPPEGSRFALGDYICMRYANPPGHPYMIGARHVAYASDHCWGVLDAAVIRMAEQLEMAHCDHQDHRFGPYCHVPYDQHRCLEYALEVFIPPGWGDKAQPNVREWECSCGHKWVAAVELVDNTPNLSGEKTQFCPKCEKKPLACSPWRPRTLNDLPGFGAYLSQLKEAIAGTACEGFILPPREDL